MRNLDTVAEQLFNEIRGRYSSVTIGDAEGNITSAPSLARFYEFDFKSGNTDIGKVSVSLDEKSGVTIMYNKDFTEEVGAEETNEWYGFLKQMRMFSKKRLLNFEVRDINRTNFTKRDYASMAVNRGETQMAESKMYGTHKTSFQKFGSAKLSIKHTGNIIEGESRNKKIGSLFIENAQGERFKYPFKHLSGARAMAIHVSEGGHPYDDFGKHITGLSEELSNLRKFKTYMGRSSVMAESLAEHMGTINERIVAVKKTIQTLQKPSNYQTAFEEYVPMEESEVPADVASNWIDQLTIKQFNEDLKDVFPYIYKLVGEATASEDLTFDDIMAEADVYPPRGDMEMDPSNMRPQAKPTAPKTSIRPQARPAAPATSPRPQARPQVYDTPAQAIQAAEEEMAAQPGQVKTQFEKGEDYTIQPVQGGFIYKLAPTVNIGASPSGGTRGIGGAAYESQIDAAFDKLLGQFSDNFTAQVEAKDGQIDRNGDGKNDWEDVKLARMAAAAAAQDDNDEETKESKTPLGEFILSYYDRQQGVFPKGETAVLTMIEKSYGDQYIKPASQFIERLGQVFEKYQQKKLGEVEVEENFLSRMIGANSARPQDFVDKAMQISQRYENLAFKNKIASDPNRPFNGKQGGAFLIELYMELINMSREIQKLGGGNKTMKNAQQQMSLIRQAMTGPVNNPEAARLMKAARVEPQFIVDFVKQDIQSIGESQELDRITSLAGLK